MLYVKNSVVFNKTRSSFLWLPVTYITHSTSQKKIIDKHMIFKDEKFPKSTKQNKARK